MKTDQTGRMPRLIRVFAGRTNHFVGFVMRWLKCQPVLQYTSLQEPVFPIRNVEKLTIAMILSFRTDRSEQTVQTQIRLLLENRLIRVYTVCHSICSFWTHYSVLRSPCLNFMVITANLVVVRVLGDFMVHCILPY